MFKHKELQQQLMDTKLQRITEMMKEVEEKQQKERDLVSLSSVLGFKQARGRRRDGEWCFQLLTDATESRRKCELMKEQEIRLKQQVGQGGSLWGQQCRSGLQLLYGDPPSHLLALAVHGQV